jgi:hypothetical protein
MELPMLVALPWVGESQDSAKAGEVNRESERKKETVEV